MIYADLLLQDDFKEEPQGFFSRILWFQYTKRYPTIFHMLRQYVQTIGKSMNDMIEYDVYLIVDPYEQDFRMDLLYQDQMVETFDLDEGQRVQLFADLVSDVAYSVAYAVPF